MNQNPIVVRSSWRAEVLATIGFLPHGRTPRLSRLRDEKVDVIANGDGSGKSADRHSGKSAVSRKGDEA